MNVRCQHADDCPCGLYCILAKAHDTIRPLTRTCDDTKRRILLIEVEEKK
jgi:hypothetical protein